LSLTSCIALQEPGTVFAVLRYSGQVDEDLRTQKRAELLSYMAEDRLEPQQKDGSLLTYTAQYNDPRVKPFFRRNEVLVAISEFDVWQK
jgi:SOUL heme-binding protein